MKTQASAHERWTADAFYYVVIRLTSTCSVAFQGLFHGDLKPIEAFNNLGQASQSPVEARQFLADESD